MKIKPSGLEPQAEAKQSIESIQIRLKSGCWQQERNHLKEKLAIVKSSLGWIRQVDRSTQRRYSTGKVNQINLLEVKVRKAELESQIQVLLYKIAQTESQVGYMIGAGMPTSIERVPWSRLNKHKDHIKKDYRELALQKETKAAQSKLRAMQLSYVPDLTIGAAYSSRENLDGHGDFISGFVQFSLPLWGETANKVGAARAVAIQKSAMFDNYKLMKTKTDLCS